MSNQLVILPEAEQDLAEAYDWYEGRRAGLGDEFLTCVEACFQAIRRAPRRMRWSMRITAAPSSGAFPTSSSTSLKAAR